MMGHRRKIQRTSPHPLTLAILALLLLAAAWLGWRLYRLSRAASAVRADAQAARALVGADLQDVDPEELLSLLHATGDDLRALQAAARPFLPVAPHVGWLPRYGPTIQAAPVLLDVALDLVAAAETVVDPLTPLLEAAGGGNLPPDRSLLSAATLTLAQARPQFDRALVLVQEARAARGTLDAQALHPRLQDWIALLDRALPLLERGVRGAQLAPELLGAEGPRTYLLLVQNEDELRATGGFISGAALITLRDGQIERNPFEDSYAVDDFSQPYPEPPAPLREFLLADLWLFRDSNWSPDFPTAARQAIELYTIGRDVEIDGVVALDQRAISLLVAPLGPLQVQGSDQPVTGQNVLQIARQAWAPGEEIESDWWRQRKDIMGQVLDAAMQQLERGMDRQRLLGLGAAALQALREKHLLVTLGDRAAASLLRELGWDGALAHPPGDTLMVVDTNVGFNKVNAVVERSLDYALDLTDPTRPRATLTVRHRHPVEDWVGPCSQRPRYAATYADMTRRCYYDYLRVYAPPGAELLSATQRPVPGSVLLSGQRYPGDVRVSRGEGGRTVFATFLVLRPGEAAETAFAYALPAATLGRVGDAYRYQLTLQKQPGTDAPSVTVALALPPGADLLAADPPPFERDGGVLRYRLDLRTDLQLDITWRPVSSQ